MILYLQYNFIITIKYTRLDCCTWLLLPCFTSIWINFRLRTVYILVFYLCSTKVTGRSHRDRHLSILYLGAGNKSTNGLATFAVQRTWRLRSLNRHRRFSDENVPFPMERNVRLRDYKSGSLAPISRSGRYTAAGILFLLLAHNQF